MFSDQSMEAGFDPQREKTFKYLSTIEQGLNVAINQSLVGNNNEHCSK